MKIGVITDTHENVGQIKKAVEFLNSSSVDMVLHAGDIISPIMTDHLNKLNVRMLGVFGNNDGEKNLWRRRLSEFPNGAEIRERYAEVEAAGAKFLVIHEPYLLDSLVAGGKYDFIIYGHTHVTDLRLDGRTVVLNPGETCGLMSGKSVAAVINLDAKTVVVTDLDSGREVARLNYAK
ncbi:MAG: metallophosphoesterase [Endomicrobiia bacterium]|nr:metallophosphoesterase [Endomicrobiia bacterium]